MGIINHDLFVASNGVQKADTYVSFNNEPIQMFKVGSNYSVRANYRIFWDKASKDANKMFLELRSVSVVLTPDQLETNLYRCLYDELKKAYTNYSDEDVVSASAPAPAPSSDAPAPSSDAPAPSSDASAPSSDAPAPSSA